MKLQIAVFGGSTEKDKRILKLAQEAGTLIAEKRATLFCGNSTGVLAAALEGAKKAGGTTVVVAPYDHKEVDLKNIDIYIASSLNWFTREPSLVNSLEGAIVIGGGIGTLTELAYAWWQEIPLVILETGELSDQYIGKGFDKRKQHTILGAKTPKEAVELLWRIMKKDGK